MGHGASFLDPLGVNKGRNVKDQLLDPLNLSRSIKGYMNPTPAAATVNAAGDSTPQFNTDAASKQRQAARVSPKVYAGGDESSSDSTGIGTR